MASNRFWHIVSVVKEQCPPVLQKGYLQPLEYVIPLFLSQHLIADFHSRTQHRNLGPHRPSVPFSTNSLPPNPQSPSIPPPLLIRYSQMPQSSLASRLLTTIQRRFQFRPGDRIGVAVSGGGDSVALLLLLLDLRERLGVVLSVIHFNHELRGRASDEDEKFVAKLAAKHELAFHSTSAHVARKAKMERANLEDAGRRARYDFFQSLVDSGHCTRIAVAHTADDQAETVLAHIFRGTGLAGLGGIHPVRGSIFRPLLGFRRNELRSYLRSRKQPWREDATNLDLQRTRARIRKKLLPLLEKNFQPAIVEHLDSLADLAREDEAFLNAFTEARIAELAREFASRIHIPTDAFSKPLPGAEAPLSPAITTRIIRRIVARLKVLPGELSNHHVNAILQLARDGQSGSSLPLPGGVLVRRDRNDLVFIPLSNTPSFAKYLKPAEYSHTLDPTLLDQHVSLPQLQCVIRFRVIDWPLKRGQTSKTGAVLDFDRLRSPLVLRNWRPGDKLQPFGHRGPHKLKRFFNEKRISRMDRLHWPILASGGVVVWTRGLPAAAEFVAGRETRKALLVEEESL